MILERIKEYIDQKGISIAAFERSVGMSNASFSKSLKNNGSIGSDKIENILSVYAELSPKWLFTGEGNMLKSESDAHDTPPAVAATCSPDRADSLTPLTTKPSILTDTYIYQGSNVCRYGVISLVTLWNLA